MKKIVSLLLVLTLILSAFSLAGCSDKSDGEGEGLTVCVVVSSAFGDRQTERGLRSYRKDDRMSAGKLQAAHDGGC